MKAANNSADNVSHIHRDPLFERCLDALRNKGGEGAVAAKKTEEFIASLKGSSGTNVREKFSFTRNGEARIRYCRKIDLGGGYRLVCLLKDGHLVLLYAGSHDECSRWIMRNRGMKYEIESAAKTAPIVRDAERQNESDRETRTGEDRFSDTYEEELMGRVDDTVLRRIFSGLTERS